MSTASNGHSRKGGGRSNIANDDSIKWRKLASLDMYRKVPVDLLEGSYEGRIISWCTILIIVLLFSLETMAFLVPAIVTELALDTATDFVEVRFNITMMDLKCEYATIDVVSVLGKEQNVTKYIRKWSIDGDGIQQQYEQTRNLQQQDVPVELHDTKVTETLEDLHKNGEDAIALDGEDMFNEALENFDFVFVDFFAMWCSHCRMLMPTWEKYAEVMYDAKKKDFKEKERHVQQHDYTNEEYEQAARANDQYSHNSILIAKVDCVKNKDLCRKQYITSYPTLRLFINGERYIGGDYAGHRTVYSFISFLLMAEERDRVNRQQQEDDDNHGKGNVAVQDQARHAINDFSHGMTMSEERKVTEFNLQKHDEKWNKEDHPGCQIVGRLYVRKAPAHFYIQARSQSQQMVPSMTNVSHEIHHLSFHTFNPKVANLLQNRVDPDTYSQVQNIVRETESKNTTTMDGNPKENFQNFKYLLPKSIKEKNVLKPMDGNVYITENYHQAYHHYIKLVSTNKKYFQMIQNSQLMMYPADDDDKRTITTINEEDRNSLNGITTGSGNKVPEAKFIMDLSPIAVSYKITNKKSWYDYVTSLMAIIGGAFTVVGIVESFIRLLNEQRIRKQRKQQFMKQRVEQQTLEQEELIQRQARQQQLLQEQALFHNNDQPIQQQEIRHRS